MSVKEDISFILARNIATTNYVDIPGNVVDSTKRNILDTLGVMVGGSGVNPGVGEVVKLVKEIGGREESSILVFDGKVPVIMAAFANGSMGHVLNYDDVVTEAFVHPTSPILAAALAIAERVGKVNGKVFITAVTLGIDLAIRMSLAVVKSKKGFGYDWHSTGVIGPFASAAVAGKLLGLDEDKIANSLGIAFLQSAGTFQMNWGGNIGITYHRDAFPAKAGVLSALLAQRGITGVKDWLQGKAGLYNLYFRGACDPFFLTDNLGKRFEGTRVSIKAFPIAGGILSYGDAVLAIVREYDISPEDIAEITVSFDYFTRHFCEPLELRRRPLDRMSAALSLPFIVATAVAKRKINIDSFSSESLEDPTTLEIAQRVMIKFEPELRALAPTDARPAIIEIKTKRGKSYLKRVDFAYGSPKNPMTTDDLIGKFKECISYAAKPIPKSNTEEAIKLILNLEEVDDISQVIHLFT